MRCFGFCLLLLVWTGVTAAEPGAVRLDADALGRFQRLAPGHAVEVPEFPGQSDVTPNLPPPEVGEHTLEVLRGLGYSEAQCAAMRQPSRGASRR